MSEKLPTIIKPPEIQDHTDDDPDSEYLKLRITRGYPDINVDPTVVKMEIDYAKRISLYKTIKAVLLAAISAIGVLLYTWMLLVT